MSQSTDYILLGNISGVHGLKGWLKVFSHTSPRLKIAEYPQWFLKKGNEDWKAHKVISGREQGKNIIVRLEGINDRSDVEALIGFEVAIKNEQLEPLSNGEYYWRDLLGLSVKTIAGADLGKLDWIFNSGSNDVLVVKDDGVDKKERLLPFLFDKVVISIDLEKSLMIVDWDPEF